jgi:hypothetical protein
MRGEFAQYLPVCLYCFVRWLDLDKEVMAFEIGTIVSRGETIAFWFVFPRELDKIEVICPARFKAAAEFGVPVIAWESYWNRVHDYRKRAKTMRKSPPKSATPASRSKRISFMM